MGQNDDMWWHRLNDEMKQQGLKRRDVARLTGVSYDTVKKWVSGDVINGPNRDHRDQLCAGLGINEAWLMQGLGPRHPLPQSIGEDDLIDEATLGGIIELLEMECRTKGQRPVPDKYAKCVVYCYDDAKRRASKGLDPIDPEAVRRAFLLVL